MTAELYREQICRALVNVVAPGVDDDRVDWTAANTLADAVLPVLNRAAAETAAAWRDEAMTRRRDEKTVARIRNYARRCEGSGNSAYAKAGRELLAILEGADS